MNNSMSNKILENLPFNTIKPKGNPQANMQMVPTEVVEQALDGPFANFFAVEDPLIVLDSIPRDLERQSTQPSKVGLQLFKSYEEAAGWAQRQNRKMLILKIGVEARVIPQLPLVEPVKAA